MESWEDLDDANTNHLANVAPKDNQPSTKRSVGEMLSLE
jgi:hypothetical protein